MFPEQLSHDLDCLIVFRKLYKQPVFNQFAALLKAPCPEQMAEFVSSLYETGTDSWSDCLEKLVIHEETCLVPFAAAKKELPVLMARQAEKELKLLSLIGSLRAENILPSASQLWTARKLDLAGEYFDRLAAIETCGFGDFSRYHMFRLISNGSSFKIQPVENPDPVNLSDLIGYDLPRSQVISNTKALLGGYPAGNVLLYGDAGTGKSATVKAITNEYFSKGLRLIELGKEQLHLLPDLLDTLAKSPLKFILFIDDLSFQKNDDDFAALKAVLEGSVSARSRNTVIYATSNRRHIVKETFQDRAGDEIHRNDSMQETVSLSERFGLRVLFEKPKKELYLQIVNSLADRYGLDLPEKELAQKAEAFALKKAGRSARAARQLVEQLAALPEEQEEHLVNT